MKKQISIKSAYLALSMLLVGILISLQLGYSALYGILLGLIAAYMIAFFHGFTHKQILAMMMMGIKSTWIVLLMMSIIGMIIGLWMLSGTIPTMMYMGFKYLSNINIVLAAFFISSIISMMLGTSLGTISTVGMALIGIGKGLNIPLPLLVGSIVSGSYFGDRSSPMSSSANLTAAMTKTQLIDNLKHMMSTLAPVYILCTFLYYIMGKPYIADGKSSIQIIQLQELLLSHFNISLMLMIPPILIMFLAVLRFSMIKSLGIGLLSSLILLLYSHHSLSEVLYAAVWGFHSQVSEISSILSGGGLISMKGVILIIASSTALNGILDETGMIEPLMKKFITGVKNIGDLILRTSFLNFIIDVIACNQTLSIIIAGKFLQNSFKKMNVSKNTLARTISDTGIVMVPLIPWNVNAMVITAIFHVSVFHFAPYSFLCYLLPIITIIYGYIGFVKKNS